MYVHFCFLSQADTRSRQIEIEMENVDTYRNDDMTPTIIKQELPGKQSRVASGCYESSYFSLKLACNGTGLQNQTEIGKGVLNAKESELIGHLLTISLLKVIKVNVLLSNSAHRYEVHKGEHDILYFAQTIADVAISSHNITHTFPI